jgi:ketosteroid isomerase-like protein
VSRNVTLVRTLNERFSAGDREGAQQLLHPDLRIEQPSSFPHGGWHHGLSGMGEMGTTFAKYWTRSITDPRILGCDDGTVVQITTQTWTATATGRSATVDVVELFSFADDQISQIRVFQQDSHLLLETLEPGEDDSQ